MTQKTMATSMSHMRDNGTASLLTDEKKEIARARVLPFIIEFFVNALLGLLLGAIIDRIAEAAARAFLSWRRRSGGDGDSKKVAAEEEEEEEQTNGGISRTSSSSSEKNKKGLVFVERAGLFAQGTVQLLINVLVLYALTMTLPQTLHHRWQNTIPGLAFPALFFGVQANMLSNIRGIFT